VGDEVELGDGLDDANVLQIAPYLSAYSYDGAATGAFADFEHLDLEDVLDDPDVQELRRGETTTVDDYAFLDEDSHPPRVGTWAVTRAREEDSFLVEFWHMFGVDESDDFDTADVEHWRLEFAQAIRIRRARTWERI
jgi:hypothetical protein